MALSEKIFTLRKNSGMSQDQLAVKLGVSRQTVSKWELGTTIPDTVHIIALSKLFDITTDFLLTDTDEPERISYPYALSKIEVLLLNRGYLLGYPFVWRELRAVIAAAIMAWIYMEAISLIGVPLQDLPFPAFILPIAAAAVGLFSSVRMILILLIIHKIRNLDQN